ncbi:hypothetical protein V6N12_075884 [Hibiscus sabdariffa]|uniref:Uncharacterized protein n=1 Tax=Hibiscus sabdariffa TaxID=183260 RepID=A0ABR1ZFA5_9ROSI
MKLLLSAEGKVAECQMLYSKITDAGTHIEFADEVIDATGDMPGLDDAGEARENYGLNDKGVILIVDLENKDTNTKHVGEALLSKDELYCPWLVVESRCRWTSSGASSSKVFTSKEVQQVGSKGSRFSTLENEEFIEKKTTRSPGLNLWKPARIRMASQPVLMNWMLRFSKQLDMIGEKTCELERDTSKYINSSSLGDDSMHNVEPVIDITNDSMLEGMESVGAKIDMAQ